MTLSCFPITIGHICPKLPTASQEEDFVGNLYHRTLLRDFERDDVDMILVDAIAYVNKDINIANKNIKYALHDRLSLRRALLSAVDLVQNRDRQRVNGWERCLELLPSVSQTAGLGLPSENSFSIKIQQKLASSVPPRSIVNISIDDAVAHLSRICQDGRDAYRILDYHGGSNLLVGKSLISRFVTHQY